MIFKQELRLYSPNSVLNYLSTGSNFSSVGNQNSFLLRSQIFLFFFSFKFCKNIANSQLLVMYWKGTLWIIEAIVHNADINFTSCLNSSNGFKLNKKQENDMIFHNFCLAFD